MTKTKYTEIEGLATIIEQERAKFTQLDTDIQELEIRITEINEELPKNGMQSVSGIRNNAALKTELEHLQTALEANKAARKAMVEEDASILANQVRNALSDHYSKVTAEYRAELKEQIAIKQAEINAIHREALAKNKDEYELLTKGLVEAQPYLTHKDSRLILETLHLYVEAIPQDLPTIMM